VGCRGRGCHGGGGCDGGGREGSAWHGPGDTKPPPTSREPNTAKIGAPFRTARCVPEQPTAGTASVSRQPASKIDASKHTCQLPSIFSTFPSSILASPPQSATTTTTTNTTASTQIASSTHPVGPRPRHHGSHRRPVQHGCTS
jgi:hypothetical protein